VLARELAHRQLLDVQCTTLPVVVGMARRHGVRTGAAVPVPVPPGVGWVAPGSGAGAGAVGVPGRRTCGSVARLADAGSVGRYSGPRWPQPAKEASRAMAAQARRVAPLHRMERTLDINGF
jgi:hypothetical protein